MKLLFKSAYQQGFKQFAIPLIFLLVFIPFGIKAQSDSTRVLDSVVVSAYRADRPVSEVPAAVNIVNEKELNRFSPASLLSAVNTIPGVRMEERSPGSYRFAIRGSSLRSPFGVRNVKFYWNGLPITDGGGNTYLNLIDFNSVGSMEIIKGPGASLYGAGTGGVVLLKSPDVKKRMFQISALGGSYGLQQYNGAYQNASSTTASSAGFTWQQAAGYREQSDMDRAAVYVNHQVDIGERNSITLSLLGSSLHYETPGGLTAAQYNEDAQQARPGAGASLGAVDQQAKVTNNTIYVNALHNINWSNRLSTRTGIFGSYTEFVNPTIRNYEQRQEKNIGARSETQYVLDVNTWKVRFTGGFELQNFNSTVNVFGNDQGQKTTQQTGDQLTGRQALLFLQTDWDLPHSFFLTVGSSLNLLRYQDQIVLPADNLLTKKFDPDVSPRIAILKKFNSWISAYGSVSRGFSPPTFAEALPSTGGFNTNLDVEKGTNYEVGVKAAFTSGISFEFIGYDFQVKNAIVIQRAEDGAEYFINAGRTSQRGLEMRGAYSKEFMQAPVQYLRIWSSATLNHYRFENYTNSGTDFSGNKLTGVAPDVVLTGVDLSFRKGIYLNVTSNYTDHIPLNDGNTEFAKAYFLLGSRVGFRHIFNKSDIDFFAGVDNALDKKYNLGNDLNAVGGRYYNVAAGRNFYTGIKVRVW